MVSRGRHFRRVTYSKRALAATAALADGPCAKTVQKLTERKGVNRAFVGKTFPVAEVAEATRHLELGKAAGKVVLTF